MTRSPRVLFVTYGGGHVGMVLPVIRALEAQLPGVDCQLMALTTGHRKASAVRPTLGYRNFLHLVDADAARAWGLRLSQGNTSPDVPTDETIAYLGINYLDLIAQHGEDGASAIYRQHGRRGFFPLCFMRRVIDELKPDAVVATNSPRSEQAALEVAKSMNITTLGMVDLYGLDSDLYAQRRIQPDVTCVIAEVVRQRLLGRGMEAERVVVTGNPAFDGLFSEHNKVAAQRFLDSKCWSKLSCILWAGHAEPYNHPQTSVPAGMSLPLEIERVLREHVIANDELCLVVRYHPSDWYRYPRHSPHPRIHFSETPHELLHPLLQASAIVVVQTSTVGLEAAIVGIPVLAIENSPSAQDEFNLVRLGVASPCLTPAELPQRLTEILQKNYSIPTDYATDGGSAARVADVLISMLKTSCSINPLS